MSNYAQYVLFKDVEYMGCYSTERLQVNETKCPWGLPHQDSADPGFRCGQGLFERHGLTYPKGAIHVGLWKFEESEDYRHLVGENLVGFEANPFVYENYSKVTCDIYGFESFNVALGATVSDEPKILYAPSGRMDCGGFYSHGDPYPVSVSTLDVQMGYRSDQGWKPHDKWSEYNFLNVDAEGAELDILKGSVNLLEQIDYIMVESSTDDRFRNGSTIQEIEMFLAQWDFNIREVEEGLTTSRGWGDAFFVREGL